MLEELGLDLLLVAQGGRGGQDLVDRVAVGGRGGGVEVGGRGEGEGGRVLVGEGVTSRSWG